MTKEERVIKIKEHIDAVYGADCAYYNVDGFAIAEELDNAGYRKISDIAKEILKEIDDALHKMATEYADRGHPTYFAVCEMVHHKVIRPIEKKYESEENV